MKPRRNYLSLLAGFFLLFMVGAAYFNLRDGPKDLAKDRLKRLARDAEKKGRNDALEALNEATAKGAELGGADDQGRPLWSVGAAAIKTESNENGDTQNATLTNAHATLYREGVPETTLRSAKMTLRRDDKDRIHLTLDGGVTAQTQSQAITRSTKGKLPKGATGALVMKARQAEVDVTARRMVAKNGVTLTQGNGEQSLKATAPQLTADSGLSLVQLSGGVTAQAPQGTFRAPSASWNWKTRRVNATGGVTATHENTVLTGARLDADVQGKSGTVSGDVRMRSDKGEASAERVAYNWGEGRLTASGGVTLSQDGASLRASRIECDDKLQDAVASGGVSLSKDGMRLTASEAQATQGLSRATASGGVTIVKDDVTLRASRVDSFDNFARAEATGAVHLTRGGMSLRAGHAEVFDKATRAVASGGITLTQDDLTVTASRAEATGLGGRTALGGKGGTGIPGTLRVVATGGVTAKNTQGIVRAARVTWGGGKIAASGGVSARRADLSLSASQFNGDDKGENATLTGNVIVRHSSGATLHAPSARYSKDAKRVWATGGIVFKDAQGSLLRGKDMVANLDLENAQITGMEGTINLRGPKGKGLLF